MTSVPPWPAVAQEPREWTPRISPELLSRSARLAHQGPYRAAVVPLVARASLALPAEVATEVAEASADIARFDAEIGAELAPFASVLLRTESASSSQIEHLTTSAKALALAELGEPGRRNATEVVGNVQAMNAALALSDRLDVDAVLAMHRTLLSEIAPEIAGRWRAEQVWIGGTSYGPHLAAYVAPHHEHVPALMDDLVAFVAREDLPPLVHAALAHAQLETVHPFADGNGRTGRALIHAMLRARGLTRQVTVPVSAGLLTDTDRYFAALDAYRAGNPLAIVRELAAASDRALVNGRQLVDDLRSARASWDDRVHARRGAVAWRLADLVVRQPVVNAAAVADRLGVAPGNAMRAISPLVEAGVLTEISGHRRQRIWQATEVLTARDAFAARAGRRSAG